MSMSRSVLMVVGVVCHQAMIASSTIPFLSADGFGRKFRGMRVLDGGITNNTPLFTDNVRRQIVFQLTDIAAYPLSLSLRCVAAVHRAAPLSLSAVRRRARLQRCRPLHRGVDPPRRHPNGAIPRRRLDGCGRHQVVRRGRKGDPAPGDAHAHALAAQRCLGTSVSLVHHTARASSSAAAHCVEAAARHLLRVQAQRHSRVDLDHIGHS